MHELASWRAAKLANKRKALDEAHAQMIEALGQGLLSFGAAASAATRRIRSIEVEASEAAAAHDDQHRKVFEYGLRAHAVDRAVDAAHQRVRAAAERKSLEELIDLSQQQPGSVPRKL